MMSIFLSIYRKNQNYEFPNQEDFHEYLPFQEPKTACVVRGNSVIYTWQWGAIIDHSISSTKIGCLFIQGICDDLGKEYLENHLFGERDFDWTRLPHACSAVGIDDWGLYAVTSVTGCEIIYYTINDEIIAVSNRIGLLSKVSTLTPRTQALMELAGQRHVSNDETIFNEVKRLVNGQRLWVKNRISQLIEFDFKHLWLDRQLTFNEAGDLLDNYVNSFSFLRKKCSDKKLMLSGGKDSRALLGLLDSAGLVDNYFSCESRGDYFHPDVMSAQDVVSQYDDIGLQHTIAYPFAYELMKDAHKVMANALFASEGLTGLAEIASIKRDKNLTFLGQNVDILTENELDIEEYLIKKIKGMNPCNYVNADVAKDWASKKIDRLREALTESPVEKYALLDDIFANVIGWKSVAVMTGTVAASVINPFLNFQYYKILLNLPHKYIESRLFMFYLMEKCGRPIAYQPFANDSWPKKLFVQLKEMGYSYGPELESVRPYPYRPQFPMARVFGASFMRHVLMEVAKKFLPDYIQDNRNKFHFLNKEVFWATLNKDYDDIPFHDMHRILALLSGCLSTEYCELFLRKTCIDKIAKELERYMPTVVKDDPAVFFKNQLILHSKSIAKFVHLTKNLEEELDSYSEAQEWIALERMKPHSLYLALTRKRYLEISGKLMLQAADSYRNVVIYLTLDGENRPIPGLTKSAWLPIYYVYPLMNDNDQRFNVRLNLPNNVEEVGIHFMYVGAKENICRLAKNPRVSLTDGKDM